MNIDIDHIVLCDAKTLNSQPRNTILIRDYLSATCSLQPRSTVHYTTQVYQLSLEIRLIHPPLAVLRQFLRWWCFGVDCELVTRKENTEKQYGMQFTGENALGLDVMVKCSHTEYIWIVTLEKYFTDMELREIFAGAKNVQPYDDTSLPPLTQSYGSGERTLSINNSLIPDTYSTQWEFTLRTVSEKNVVGCSVPRCIEYMFSYEEYAYNAIQSLPHRSDVVITQHRDASIESIKLEECSLEPAEHYTPDHMNRLNFSGRYDLSNIALIQFDNHTILYIGATKLMAELQYLQDQLLMLQERITQLEDAKEDRLNKITQWNTPTDEQYPSAKLVYDTVQSLPKYPLLSVLQPPHLSTFQWVNQGNCTASEVQGGIVIANPAPGSTGDKLRCLVQPLSNQVFDAVCGVSGLQIDVSFQMFFIALYNSTSNRLLSLSLRQDNLCEVIHWNNATSWNSTPWSAKITMQTGPLLFFRITQDAQYRKYYISTNGIVWTLLYTHSVNTWLTPSHVGFGINPYNATYELNCLVVHWNLLQQ